MSPAKIRAVASLWTLALGLSAALVGAGERWSAPLPVRGDWAAALVLLPPLLMALWLLGRWALPGEGGESDPISEDTRA
ncbi:MAG: hypothetical protein ACKOZW_01400 [Cyanobium sp.]